MDRLLIKKVPRREIGASRAALNVVVTGTSSDAHTWNLVYLQLLVEELGHRVTNLGPTVPVSLLVEHCLAHRPDLVVVGSVNGHGALDGRELISALRAVPELRDTRVVIGGKLGIGGADDREIPRDLLDAGFDAVFLDDGAPGGFPAYLKALSRGPGR